MAGMRKFAHKETDTRTLVGGWVPGLPSGPNLVQKLSDWQSEVLALPS